MRHFNSEVFPIRDQCPQSVASATSYESPIVTKRDESFYHVAPDAIVILDVFGKKTQATPVQILEVCQKRLAAYLRAISDKEYT